jgi:hypothetical protein
MEAFVLGMTAHRPKEERNRLVRAMRSSGQTQIAWCSEHGVNIHTFKHWVEEIAREEGNKNDEPRWVKVVREEPSSPEVCEAWSGVEVLVGRYAVKVSRGFDKKMFKLVCGLLSEIC